MALQPGATLGPYEVLSLIGAGGMGEVWLATEVRLGRKVALKVLQADLTREPLRVHRFEREARAASALNHPNVCTIHALGETADGQHYIAMEYVDGETLRQRLSGTRLTIREALARVQQAEAGDVANRILLEMGTASGQEPTDVVALRSHISTFLNDVGISLGAEDEGPFTMRLLHFRRTFVEKMFAIHGKVQLLLRDGRSGHMHAITTTCST